MFFIILRIVGTEIPLGFYISTKAMVSTGILFSVIFLIIFLNTVRKLKCSKPVELLRGGNVGEKEPKAKWFLAVLGILCLGAGYYLSVTVENPIAALSVFLYPISR